MLTPSLSRASSYSMRRQDQTPDALEPISGGLRSDAADIVKGIAIILVVFGHTAQGLMHRGWWTSERAIFSDRFIYSFHMPAFFFIAGLFVNGSIKKRGAKTFTAEKLKTVLWPYVTVSVLGLISQPFVNHFRSASSDFSWKVVILDFIDGEGNWFLFTLFFCLMLALLTVKLPPWFRFLLAAAITLTPPFGPPLTNQVLHEFCFLAAGMWVGRTIYQVDKIPPAVAVLGVVVLSALQIWGCHHWQYQWAFIVLGLTGTAGLFLLARLLNHHQLGSGLAWIGRASLAVFIFSSFPQGATREILSHIFHTHRLWLQLILPTVFATLLPVVIWYRQDRWRLGWLFRWP